MFAISDPILMFTVLILAMLLAPLLAQRFRVPDLVILLIAGIVLGPNGLGVLERNTAVTLFGAVGLLYIMFLAGLEIDLHRFRRTGRRSILFGFLTFAIPQGLGTLAGYYLLGFNWTASLLLASMFASHTLLAYPLAGRLGIAATEPVIITVGATIITDTLALLVLAVIADSARGVTLGTTFWLSLAVGMLVLVLIIWWGLPRLTRWFFQNVTEEGSSQFLFVLATVCACAYLSHFAKMEPIIGAFLAGASFNRLIPEHSVLRSRVVFAGNTIFIPFFLISVGMLVDPLALATSPRSWLIAITMVVMVVFTKFAAAWLTGAMLHYDRDARRVMFGLSVVQAAATLAAVLVGYELKIFDDAVLNGAIAMIIVTCPLGAWMVDRHGRALAVKNVQTAPREHRTNSEQRILVPVVNPASATRMLDLAFLLRDTTKQGSIHPITIVLDEGNTETELASGERLLAHCLAHAGSANIPVTPSVRVDVNSSDGIVRAAKELHANLVLIGWGREPTTRSKIFGTLTKHLIDYCPERLVFSRLVRPLNTTSRLLLLLPPLAHRRPDLSPLLRDAKFLAAQIGANLRVYLVGPEGRETKALARLVEAIRPSRPTTILDFPTLPLARSGLLADVGTDDLVLLLGERPTSPLWSPTLDKLSELFLARFPNHNFLVAYPPLSPDGVGPIPEWIEGATDTPRLTACELAPGLGISAALQHMLTAAFPLEPETSQEAFRLLLAAAQAYPVEMPADTVLLHAHSERIVQPSLLVGQGPGCWDLPNLATPPRTILALLSPKTSSPEQHLKTLAELGRRFHDAAAVKALTQASSAAEFCRILGTPTTPST